jgi:hypothetical protein
MATQAPWRPWDEATPDTAQDDPLVRNEVG